MAGQCERLPADSRQLQLLLQQLQPSADCRAGSSESCTHSWQQLTVTGRSRTVLCLLQTGAGVLT